VLDAPLRRVSGPVFAAAGRRLAAAGIRPGWVTAGGWVLGVGACLAVGFASWTAALALWLANRVLDGLDGAVARAGTPSTLGGYLDLVADFSVYAGFVLAVAVAVPPARLACTALLFAYYLSGSAFLALSSLLERRGRTTADGRSLHFVGGLAEGAETIVVYVLVCLLPGRAAAIAWTFAAVVAVTAVQRVVTAVRLLGPGVSAGAERPASGDGWPAAAVSPRDGAGPAGGRRRPHRGRR
jgi:phosphatidylglycerophosphate synthase